MLPSPPTSRRQSPPRTPVENLQQSRATSTPSSDDSSIIDDLSFEYVLDLEGKVVRLSKGSSKSNNSSPPTPQETHLQPDPPPAQFQKPSSPILLNSPVRRGSLSRSESAFPILNGPSTDRPAAPRSFQRVASGPLLTPASTSQQSRPRTLPRRITIEDQPSHDIRTRKQQANDDLRARMHHDSQQDEKENTPNEAEEPPYPSSKRHSPPLSSRAVSASRMAQARTAYSVGGSGRPLTDVPPRGPHARQVLPSSSRVTRAAKTPAKHSPIGRISEASCSESESAANEFPTVGGGDETDTADEEPPDQPSAAHGNGAPGSTTARQRTYALTSNSLGQSSNSRPRRSASLSDALHQGEPDLNPPLAMYQQLQQSDLRPGTSLGLNADASAGARRVVPEERERQEMELRVEYKSLHHESRREHEEPDRHTTSDAESRQSPSPTHNANRLRATHRRRDSDTLRSVNAPPSGSPTAVDLPPRFSPSTRAIAAANAKHRRSPTAPEVPTTSGMLAPAPAGPNSKTWASGNRDDGYASGREKEARENGRQLPPAPVHQPQQQQYAAPTPVIAAPAAPAQLNRHIVVNKKPYARLDMIGKGGSSRVYRVLNHANELYAIKRVALDKIDSDTMSSYMNEIALLKRLEGNSRIIRLIDSEVKAGPGGSKGHLLLVMECGEVDLARLLSDQQKEPVNMTWVAYYWQQMLQAVHVIHEEKIVHSDLKPANFVLVRGQLKLIDFGIANAIANDTTNIQRDHQVGTVNYMSPEAIEAPDGMRRLKVGRPSDVWSLGCILYQMVYGHPPFQHLSTFHKMRAIPDLSYNIDFPDYSTPTLSNPRSSTGSATGTTAPPKQADHLKRRVRRDVIEGMKSCLCRNPKERATIPQLMEQDWLAMKEPPTSRELLAPDETVINPHYMEQLLQYGIKLGQTHGGEMSPAELLRDAERLVIELKSIQAAQT